VATVTAYRMKKILILCTGNSCRSQMAEAYMRFFVGEKAIAQSAGITPRALHPLAVRVMQEDGIDMTEQASTDINDLAQHEYDYIITICDNARANLPAYIKGAQLLHWPIDDPAAFKGSLSEQLELFRAVREAVKKTVLRFVGREFPLPVMLAG